MTIIYVVLSVAGKEHFSTILSNFLPMLGYWISMYITILLEENIFFRSSIKTKTLHHNEFDEKANSDWSYNWSNWNKPKGITMGLAADLSFAIGVVGAVLGMNQVYFQGPIAKKIGDYSGDVGMWLCGGFTGVVYPFLRYWELKRFGR